jgi:hypothetical protein
MADHPDTVESAEARRGRKHGHWGHGPMRSLTRSTGNPAAPHEASDTRSFHRRSQRTDRLLSLFESGSAAAAFAGDHRSARRRHRAQATRQLGAPAGSVASGNASEQRASYRRQRRGHTAALDALALPALSMSGRQGGPVPALQSSSHSWCRRRLSFAGLSVRPPRWPVGCSRQDGGRNGPEETCTDLRGCPRGPERRPGCSSPAAPADRTEDRGRPLRSAPRAGAG